MCTTVGANEEFTFIWSIENYEYCDGAAKSLSSPDFTVEGLNRTRWYLTVCPNNTDKNGVGCYLYRCVEDDFCGSIALKYKFSLLTAAGTFPSCFETHMFHTFERSPLKGHGYDNFISRDWLYERRADYLPRETLTIRCRMWRDNKVDSYDPQIVKTLIRISNSNFPSDETRSNLTAEVNNLKRKYIPFANHCVARTLIGVEQVSFTWSKDNFSAWKPLKKLDVPVISVSGEIKLFAATLFLTDEEELQIDICNTETSNGLTIVMCKISLLDVEGDVLQNAEDKHVFDLSKKENWTFSSFVKRSDLISQGQVYATNDSLLLRFEFRFSRGKVMNMIETSSYLPPKRNHFCQNPDLECFKTVFNDKKFCDFTLQAGNKSFPVHKAILCARSPVFDAMFNSDMKEKDCKVLDIPDVDCDTLNQMLCFMYCGALEELDLYAAQKLYSACDKYQFLLLRNKCRCILKSNICACDLLNLSDIHRDEHLKTFSVDFICQNAIAVFLSDGFQDVIKNKIPLAAELLGHMFAKRVWHS